MTGLLHSGGPDHAAQIRQALLSPRALCEALELTQGYRPVRQAGGGLLIRCPSHGDRSPSCSVRLGPDGTLAVHCFSCGFGGDVLTLIAQVRGLDLRRPDDFRAVLEEGATLAHLSLDDDAPPPAWRPRLVRPVILPTYPPRSEVAALWDQAHPVPSDPAAVAYLTGRGLDPDAIARLDLARVLRPGESVPSWARCGAPWSVSGHRLLVPVFDEAGELRSLRAWRLTGEQPKRVAPAGYSTRGLVMANAAARALLEGNPGAETAAAPEVVIAEGEPDFLTWALRSEPGTRAVFGVLSAAWTPELGARVPSDARVALRVHRDPAGDQYAAVLRTTLAARCLVHDFPRPSPAQGPDENDQHQAGLLALDPFDGLELDPLSRARPLVRRLLGVGEASAQLAAELRRGEGLLLVSTTTGFGKTAAAHQLLAERREPAALFVPTHQLADEHVARLDALGVPSVAKKGVTRVLLPLVGSEDFAQVCQDAARAEALAILGATPRQVLCPTCPFREKHPATGQECAAYLAMDSTKAAVTVLQATIAAEVLANLTAALEAEKRGERDPDKPPAVRLAIFDEPSSLTASAVLRPSTAAEVDQEWANLTDETREGLGHLWSLVRSSLAGVASGTTLRQLVRHGARDDAEATSALQSAAELGAVRWPSAIHHRIAVAVGPHLAPWLERTTHTTQVLGALCEASRRPDAPLVFVAQDGTPSLLHVARWTREVDRFVAAGGRVVALDATANPDEWRVIFGTPVRIVRLDVADAEQVTRRWIYWSSAARRRHMGKASELRGCLRVFADQLRDIDARRAGLLTDKPTAAWLREQIDQVLRGEEVDPRGPLPDEIVALVRAGVSFELGHFGALRGLDAWSGVDALAVLGEDWPNLDALQAAADALGLDRITYAERKMSEELTQAEGRARPIHRTTPLVLLRFSRTAPNLDLAPQWQDVEVERLAFGRPRTRGQDGRHLTPSGWAAERQALGLSKRAHARHLGLAWNTYLDNEKKLPDRAPPVVGKSVLLLLREGLPVEPAANDHELDPPGPDPLEEKRAETDFPASFEPPPTEGPADPDPRRKVGNGLPNQPALPLPSPVVAPSLTPGSEVPAVQATPAGFELAPIPRRSSVADVDRVDGEPDGLT